MFIYNDWSTRMDQFFLSPIIVCGYNNGILLKINFRNIIIRRSIIYFISRYLNMLLGGADPLPQSPGVLHSFCKLLLTERFRTYELNVRMRKNIFSVGSVLACL